MIYLDTETTGLDPDYDEVLEIALVDHTGNVLLNTYVRPERHTKWREAQNVNGISLEMVANAPTFAELKETIENIVCGEHVRIYNASFDQGFVDLSSAAEVSCVMLDYAEFRGQWSSFHGNYSWHRLTRAALDLGVEWRGMAHSACADADITRRIDAAMSEYVTNGNYREAGEAWNADRRMGNEVVKVWNQHDKDEANKYKRSEEELLGMLGMRELKPVRRNTKNEDEAYAQIFFSKSIAEIHHEDICNKLKAKYGEHYYTKSKDIPSGYIGTSAVKQLCGIKYVCDLLDFPVRAVIATAKTTRDLYLESEVQQILVDSEEAQLYLKPSGYTLTELRKMGYKDDEILAQKRTGICSNNYGNSWNLYPIPNKK